MVESPTNTASSHFPRLVEWDSLALRLRGQKLATMVGDGIRQKQIPVTDVVLGFGADHFVVEGKLRKGMIVPFRLVIRRIEIIDRAVRIHLAEMSAFYLIPIPRLLLQVVAEKANVDGILLDPNGKFIDIRLDRFLPSHLDITIREIRIIDGGVSVVLDSGGADIPPEALRS